MKKSTKGAVAAVGAAVVLLGGAGTLAYWTDEATVSGGVIKTGQLGLLNPSCDTDWVLDGGEDAASVDYVPGVTLLVPGDVITKTCSYTVRAEGEHLRATVGATTPAALTAAFTVATPAVTINNAAVTAITEANHGDVIDVDLSVTFNAASGNDTKGLTETLDDIELSLTQVHS